MADLKAIVEIGSNGVRFSITNLKVDSARIMPVLFQDRCAISLFDSSETSTSTVSPAYDMTPMVSPTSGAKGLLLAGSGASTLGSGGDFKKASIHSITVSATVIDQLTSALGRFKTICQGFGVPDSNVTVIATEATTLAISSPQLQDSLAQAVGWPIKFMSKKDEIKTAACAVASSFYQVQGLFLELGGSSLQLSWILCADGQFQSLSDPISLPYGAASVTRRLKRGSSPLSKKELAEEVEFKLRQALARLHIPEELMANAEERGGFKLYLSGGGFRGLANWVLASHGTNTHPYPFPVINGFACSTQELLDFIEHRLLASSVTALGISKCSQRISERRAEQLPAVGLLMTVVLNTIPNVRKVLFTENSIREGFLYHQLTAELKVQDPLLVATEPFASRFADKYVAVLLGGIPTLAPEVIRSRLVRALVNVAFVHSSFPKDLQAGAALRVCSSGVASGAHGLSHEVRALLGLALCQRWGGELLDTAFLDAVKRVLFPKRLAWWAAYCGHLMHVVGGVYPGGVVHSDVLRLHAENETARGFTLVMVVTKDTVTVSPTVRGRLNGLGSKLKRLNSRYSDHDVYRVKTVVEWR